MCFRQSRDRLALQYCQPKISKSLSLLLLDCAGQFKPGPDAQPAIGTVGQIEYVEEDRVELVVNDQGMKVELKEIIQELIKVR